MTNALFSWQGRVDAAERGDTCRLHQIAQPLGDELPAALNGQAVVLGFCCDEGVSRNHGRIGARLAPDHVRRALAGLPAHRLQQLYDAGDIHCTDNNLEYAQSQLANRIASLLNTSSRLAVIGGGHEIAYGSYLGLDQHLQATAQPGTVLVLNLDAHFDLRTSRPASSGTPFDQILEHAAQHGRSVRYCCLGVSLLSNTPALFERARELDVAYLQDTQMQESQLPQIREFLAAQLQDVAHLYLTIDMDVLPAWQAPGVSAPAAYGVSLSVIETILGMARESGKLRLLDIAEINPEYDHDGLTAKTAARLIWRYLQPAG
ncbi:formimidoylglutamase [Advenella mimigardefordensis]|uniref:Formimidoylglutamase n=1 Tax=Advenella mimigardefordensis (strain DSM 17166 / LMG 22922 / DPN7) TaxID=1247726 RepID=W0P7K2_ADVMD|nr:formimidoylglutamase [Advenella mimigardefordensis]AHG62829.1 formimidoylglutamase [Advenella mimigardefordensis DPN7]